MEGEDSSSDDPASFQNKPAWQRFLIVFAGPLFNFILAYILAAVLIACVGYTTATIDSLMEGYPAEEAGLEPGDQILSLNNYSIHFYQEVRAYNTFHPGETLEVTVKRDGEKKTFTIEPRWDEKNGVYLIGILQQSANVKASFPQIFSKAFWEVRYMIYVTVQGLRMLVTGQLGMNDLSGPVAIVKTIGDAYEESVAVSIFYALMEMCSLTILLSANLGVMNLLPFPALDGGRLVFYLLEMIRRKKAPEKVEEYVNLVGFAILMTFMVIVMFNDIWKIFGLFWCNGGLNMV